MRKYRATASSGTRIDYGFELAEGLLLFPETAAYSPAFDTVNDDLEAAFNARREKRKPLVKARIKVRFASYELDQTIRSAGRAAEIADGGRRGPVFGAAFPEGVTPVVAPMGARQIAPTEALINRITLSKVAGMAAFSAEWLPKLGAALAKLSAETASHKTAQDDYLGAFQIELALRAEHMLAVDRLMGQVRTAFPRDRTKQDLVFPVFDDAEGGEEEGGSEADEPAPAAPAGPPA